MNKFIGWSIFIGLILLVWRYIRNQKNKPIVVPPVTFDPPEKFPKKDLNTPGKPTP